MLIWHFASFFLLKQHARCTILFMFPQRLSRWINIVTRLLAFIYLLIHYTVSVLINNTLSNAVERPEFVFIHIIIIIVSFFLRDEWGVVLRGSDLRVIACDKIHGVNRTWLLFISSRWGKSLDYLNNTRHHHDPASPPRWGGKMTKRHFLERKKRKCIPPLPWPPSSYIHVYTHAHTHVYIYVFCVIN